MASNRKPKPQLPDIAPCPDGHKRGKVEKNRTTGLFSVWCCGCCWIGPGERTKRAAILAWNNRRRDEEAERRGAEAALRWIFDNGWLTGDEADDAQAAIERGEVLPKAQSDRQAQKRGGRKA